MPDTVNCFCANHDSVMQKFATFRVLGSEFGGSRFAENLSAVAPAQAGRNPAPAGIREF